MRLLLIDNYDSFTYNLYQYLSELGASVQVRRNDAVTADEVADLSLDGLVISPGPGTPREAGVCNELIDRGQSLTRCGGKKSASDLCWQP